MRTFLTALFILCFSFTCACAHPLVNEAMLHLDKPYIYSTTGPDSFDCSGFTYYCVDTSYDFTIKRTAYEQGYDESYYKVNSIAQLQVGDLIFFDTKRDKDKCDHAGIYIGKNKFIHCSSASKTVVISELRGTFYETLFSWGRRLIIKR
jgi:cell wall-associated NlpC family hydrolase